MPECEINDTVIAYEEAGDGPPLVLAHGLGLSREMWRPQIEHFRTSNRVIVFDARGAGESGPLTSGRDVLARQAADLESLLDCLNVRRAVLCGVSYGGVLAQEFAATYPQRLAGLVIVDSFPDMNVTGPLRRIGLRLSTALAAPMLLLPPAIVVPAVRRTYARWPLARDVVASGYRKMRRIETARMRRAINRVDYQPQLAAVTCPARGIVGDASPVLVELMRRLTSALPNASLDSVPDSFDPTNLCQPELFNALLADFLVELEWSAAG
ncbi:alpha/beta fold hydrolase [Bounagaea algeriensis]